MNKYKYSFESVCPVDNERIKYTLKIESTEIIFAEDIAKQCESQKSAFHEVIADNLIKLGGKQTIKATHSGVKITTKREFK